VAKGSSQHDKCQVGNMLWTEGSSQPDRCQVGNMQSNGLDLVHSGILIIIFMIHHHEGEGPTVLSSSRLFCHRTVQ
jgi:hypothetical protein